MKPVDKIDILRKKREQIEAQLKAAEAIEKEAARKADTRRKVIAGALAVEHMEKNPASEFAKVLTRLLDEYVTRPYDRALFPNLLTENPETPPAAPPSSAFTHAAEPITESV